MFSSSEIIYWHNKHSTYSRVPIKLLSLGESEGFNLKNVIIKKKKRLNCSAAFPELPKFSKFIFFVL